LQIDKNIEVLMDSFDHRHNSEKRGFMRVETEAPVEILYEGHKLTGTCKDLSATGLQVETPIPLTLDTQVTVCIMPNAVGGELPPFRALATVARLVPVEDSDTTYGLVIDEILE